MRHHVYYGMAIKRRPTHRTCTTISILLPTAWGSLRLTPPYYHVTVCVILMSVQPPLIHEVTPKMELHVTKDAHQYHVSHRLSTIHLSSY